MDDINSVVEVFVCMQIVHSLLVVVTISPRIYQCSAVYVKYVRLLISHLPSTM